MTNLRIDLSLINDNLCSDCNGMGHIANKECPSCNATGYKLHSKTNLNEELYENAYSRYQYDRNNQDHEICSECGGMGHIHEKECFACNATGFTLKTKPQETVIKTQESAPKPYRINDQDFTLCTTCEGHGHIDDQECFSCGATGLKQRTTMKYNQGLYAENIFQWKRIKHLQETRRKLYQAK